MEDDNLRVSVYETPGFEVRESIEIVDDPDESSEEDLAFDTEVPEHGSVFCKLLEDCITGKSLLALIERLPRGNRGTSKGRTYIIVC